MFSYFLGTENIQMIFGMIIELIGVLSLAIIKIIDTIKMSKLKDEVQKAKRDHMNTIDAKNREIDTLRRNNRDYKK